MPGHVVSCALESAARRPDRPTAPVPTRSMLRRRRRPWGLRWPSPRKAAAGPRPLPPHWPGPGGCPMAAIHPPPREWVPNSHWAKSLELPESSYLPGGGGGFPIPCPRPSIFLPFLGTEGGPTRGGRTLSIIDVQGVVGLMHTMGGTVQPQWVDAQGGGGGGVEYIL